MSSTIESISKGLIRKGNPAFPAQCDEGYFLGMTLRDWFAGQLIVGWTTGTSDHADHEQAVKRAYRVADLMLKARLDVA